MRAPAQCSYIQSPFIPSFFFVSKSCRLTWHVHLTKKKNKRKKFVSFLRWRKRKKNGFVGPIANWERSTVPVCTSSTSFIERRRIGSIFFFSFVASFSLSLSLSVFCTLYRAVGSCSLTLIQDLYIPPRHYVPDFYLSLARRGLRMLDIYGSSIDITGYDYSRTCCWCLSTWKCVVINVGSILYTNAILADWLCSAGLLVALSKWHEKKHRRRRRIY